MIAPSSGHESIDGDFSFDDHTVEDVLVKSASTFYKSASSSFYLDGDGDPEWSSQTRPALWKRRSNAVADVDKRSKERKKLRRSKLVVVILAVLLTAAVSVVVYFGITQAEEENTEEAYLYGAERIALTMENNLLDELRSIESLAVYVSSYASGKETEWPFLEPIPDFATRAASARWLSAGESTSSLSLILAVTNSNREQYEEFILRHWNGADSNNTELLDYSERVGNVFPEIFELVGDPNTDGAIKKVASPVGSGPFFPVWPSDPTDLDAVNFNVASISSDWSIQLNYVVGSNEPLISVDSASTETKGASGFLQRTSGDEPHNYILFPLTDGSGGAVGVLSSAFSWTSVLNNSLTIEEGEYIVEIDNACSQAFSFRVVGPEVEFLGPGLLHDTRYNSFQYTYDPSSSLRSRAKGPMLIDLLENRCPYSVSVYPTASAVDSSSSNDAIYYTLGVTLAFLIVIVTFCCFAIVMERRQKRIIRTADEARALVSSLFPSRVRGRLMAHRRGKRRRIIKKIIKFGRKGPKNTLKENEEEKELEPFYEESMNDSELHGSFDELQCGGTQSPRRRSRLQTYLDESTPSKRSNDDANSRPIADSFPSATIMFADLVGFTSWCSLREPEKVFVLLEGIFTAFDNLAKKRKVFKIETIGDCYVCCTGVPDPQPDHAWRMAKFALEIRHKLGQVLSDLEGALGPDTCDLSMRFGINTGMVTAGVLRTEKSRFQLFGDAINMASRMETTSESNRIQLSQSTADQLIECGKAEWLRPRDDLVKVKGKGMVQTWWLASRPKESSTTEKVPFAKEDRLFEENMSTRMMCIDTDLSDSEWSCNDNSFFMSKGHLSTLVEDEDELIDTEDVDRSDEVDSRQKHIRWHTDQLAKALKRIVAKRPQGPPVDLSRLKFVPSEGSLSIDELVNSIPAPESNEVAGSAPNIDPDDIILSPAVTAQLLDFVSVIKTMYQPRNKYHSFERSTHVSMAASMFLNRILLPVECEVPLVEEMHELTHGVSSDPLAQFTILFAALVHDVDHPGVPESDFERQDPHFAELYTRCIAEQKSIDLSWELLSDSKYLELRSCIYSSENELKRFRQLLVNCLLCLGSSDADRHNRWSEAFNPLDSGSLQETKVDRLRATALIETLTQASDAAPAMQHWLVFKKWNELKFQEEYEAWNAGRSLVDPSEKWFDGELQYFENHVFPLAKRLQAFEILGGDEHLQFALNNKQEWLCKGGDMVEEWKLKYGIVDSSTSDLQSDRSDASQSMTEEHILTE